MKYFFLGKRNRQIEKKALALGLEIIFVKEVSKANMKTNKIKKDAGDYDAVLVKTQNIDIMRRIIDKFSSVFSFIIVLGMNDEINRACLEHKKTNALLSPEFERKKDFINYRNSGLNQVLCKIARDNKKIIIENLSDLQGDKKTRALLLGKIMQNARLCRKYKTKFILTFFNKMFSAFELKNFEKIIRQ